MVVGLSLIGGSAHSFEVFGKGSYSKYYYDETQFEENMSGSTGIAITLIKGVRLEGRYTRIQKLENQIDVNINGVAATLSNRSTRTIIYSLGIDIDLAGSRSQFQPYVSIGAGVLESAYSFTVVEPVVQDISLSSRQRMSGNVGLGFRWAIGRMAAIEIEGMAYATDIDKPKPIINSHITAGIRLYIG